MKKDQIYSSSIAFPAFTSSKKKVKVDPGLRLSVTKVTRNKVTFKVQLSDGDQSVYLTVDRGLFNMATSLTPTN